jgi:hypothetical protein
MIVGITWYANDQDGICEQHVALTELFKKKT